MSASVNNLTAMLGYAPGSNRLTQVSAYGRTLPVALDASGNTVGLPTLDLALTYDGAGRLSAIERRGTKIAGYGYNADGQRTRKAVGNVTTVYHYDVGGRLIAETTSNGMPIRAYVYADDVPVAQITKTSGESLLYLHADHQGTPRVATNGQGAKVWGWEGEAFGSAPPNEDPDGDGKRTTVNLRFPGQYWDAETGLFYNWNRYYSPQLGRYISFDPIGLVPGLTPEMIGRSGLMSRSPMPFVVTQWLVQYGPNQPFAYAINNPLRFTDPDGLFPWPTDCIQCIRQSKPVSDAFLLCNEEAAKCKNLQDDIAFLSKYDSGYKGQAIWKCVFSNPTVQEQWKDMGENCLQCAYAFKAKPR